MLNFLRWLINRWDFPKEKAAQIEDNTVRDRLRSVLIQDRLVDALEAAGGAADGAPLTAVNLAVRVEDEGHCKPPALEEPPPVQEAENRVVQQGESNGAGGLIDLNLAPTELLQTLPGIGPVSAQAILDYGEVNGPFQSVEEIMNVFRIGPVTYEKVRAQVTVNPTR